MSYGIDLGAPGTPFDPRVEEVVERVRNACHENGVAFLGGATLDTITEKIDCGVRVVSGSNPKIAAKGRAYTHRTMPV